MATRKENTESAAEMEARIRAEVEAKLRAEYETKMAAELTRQATTLQAARAAPAIARRKAAAELAAALKEIEAKTGQKPRYQLKEKAYIGDVLYEPELEPIISARGDPEERRPLIVTFLGRPGPHMVPKNEAAKLMWERFTPSDVDPIEDLSLITPEGNDILKNITSVAESTS